jgi:hypothetical protein
MTQPTQSLEESIQETLSLEQNKHIIQMLRPRLEKDGNQWCYIWGQMPESYIAGFGDTIALAANDFKNSYYTQKP